MSAHEIIDAETGELVPYQPAAPVPVNLFRTEQPQEIVARATETANALMTVVRAQKLTATIQGKAYPLVEAWTLCGTMLGVFPFCEWTRKIEDGWEARVVAKTLTGAVVGAAEAQCTRGERMWANREDYALRSMAQTRATSKALRQPLGFVMTLAGLETTPAEEMPRDEPRATMTTETIAPATTSTAPTSATFVAPTGQPASDAQVKNIDRLVNKITKAGVTDAVALTERMKAKFGTSVASELTKAQATTLIDALKGMAGEES